MGLIIIAALTLPPTGGSPPTLIQDFASEYIEAVRDYAHDARYSLAQAQALSFWFWTRDSFYLEIYKTEHDVQARWLEIRAKTIELRKQTRKLRELEEEAERSRRAVEDLRRQQEP